MRKLLFLFLVLIVGCVNREVNIPNDIVDSETFVDIMIDIQIREGMGTYRRQNKGISTKDELPDDLVEILKKNNTTTEDFLKTYDFYVNNPELMEGIYEQVLDSLSKLEAEIKQRFTKEERRLNDSLQDVNRRRHDSIRGILRPARIEKK